MRRIKKGSAILLAAALVFSALALPKAYAAGPIEVGKTDCSITVNVANSKYADGTPVFRELPGLPVSINLYKVANVDVSGNFTGIGSFEDIDFTGISIDEEDDVVAAYWEELSTEVAGIIDDSTSITSTKEGTTSNGTVNFTGLSTGLYLVYAQEKESTDYLYKFKPYLISLPGNNYDPSNASSSDAWVYNITVGLKPEKQDRYGDLKVIKNLTSYNETTDGAYFTFLVKASKADNDTEDVRFEYEEVFALKFDAPGQKEFVLKRIPAGSLVTVTEIVETVTNADGSTEYKSGASYKLTSENYQTETIAADQMVSVSFTNTNNGGLNDGTGKVNQFRAVYDEGTKSWVWTCEAVDDSAAADEEYRVVVPEEETVPVPLTDVQ